MVVAQKTEAQCSLISINTFTTTSIFTQVDYRGTA